jgi:hypothetical protein
MPRKYYSSGHNNVYYAQESGLTLVHSAAAAAGHIHILDWLLALPSPSSESAALSTRPIFVAYSQLCTAAHEGQFEVLQVRSCSIGSVW